ncbi:unnamed protein product [Orchesella dallaii]|uniref:Uncharacterized protein n=1 Tax=Orchesella dallaii TaxID=48710 RepID=A0ABP1QF24_9HEXA
MNILRVTEIRPKNSKQLDRIGTFLYVKLKKNIGFINQVLGKHILAFYIVVIAYFCDLPDVLNELKEVNTYSIGKLGFFLILNMTTWILAAEFHSQV